MWRQSTQGLMASNVSDLDKGEKYQQQTFGDSGFLSGASLVCSEELSSELKLEPSQAVAPEPMKALDSGVELGLSENLGQLSLTHDTINSLNKVHCDTSELPVCVAKSNTSGINSLDSSQACNITQEPWELYYSQDSDGDTQLHIAVVQGFVEAATCLVNMAPHPCLLDVFNDEGHTALHLAVLTSQSRVSRCLVIAGCNLLLRNLRGNTALHIACVNGDLESARALTDALSRSERSSLTPGKMVPALPQNLELRNYDGEMCIHLAAKANHVEVMRHLLRLGADLDSKEGLAGRTPLHLAIEYRCFAVLKFILHECKPRLDVTNYAGYTVYQVALYVNPSLAMDLIRYGAKPEPLSDSDNDNSGEEDNDETFAYPVSHFDKNTLTCY